MRLTDCSECPSNHRMKLPKALRAARESAGLSQAELAAKLDVAPSTVAGWELGTHNPRLDKLAAISKVTGVEVAELLG
jgi:transcriptional regulator with XRE-family HTH domain